MDIEMGSSASAADGLDDSFTTSSVGGGGGGGGSSSGSSSSASPAPRQHQQKPKPRHNKHSSQEGGRQGINAVNTPPPYHLILRSEAAHEMAKNSWVGSLHRLKSQGNLDTFRLSVFVQMSMSRCYRHGGQDVSSGVDDMTMSLLGQEKPAVMVGPLDVRIASFLSLRDQVLGQFSLDKLPQDIVQVGEI